MNRKRISIVWIVALVALVAFTTACKKKAPVVPEPIEAPVETVEPVEVVQEPVEVDQVEPGLPAELEELNRYLAEQGLIGDVYFDFDKYELRADARERLAKNADFMKQHPEYRFMVEGHCDDRGTNEYNLALGDRRANATKSYLMSLGASGTGMNTISYGEERPFCTTAGESCWQMNRRAHFVVVGKN